MSLCACATDTAWRIGQPIRFVVFITRARYCTAAYAVVVGGAAGRAGVRAVACIENEMAEPMRKVWLGIGCCRMTDTDRRKTPCKNAKSEQDKAADSACAVSPRCACARILRDFAVFFLARVEFHILSSRYLFLLPLKRRSDIALPSIIAPTPCHMSSPLLN